MVGRRGHGIVGTMARTAVVAGTATAVATGVSNRMKKDDQVPQGVGQGDIAGELERLADLRAKGMITEEEFSAAKEKLMGS